MEAPPEGAGGPSQVDKGRILETHDETFVGPNAGEDHDESGDDMSAQIGRALKNFAPYFTSQIQTTMESAVNTEIARRIKEEISLVLKDEVSVMIRDELDKRFPPTNTERPEHRIVVNEGQAGTSETTKEKYTYKNFTIARPPEYDGNPDPIVSTRWISETEGSFRITKSPPEWKVTLASSMLRGSAKRWWDDKVTLLGEEEINKMEWNIFKTEFFKFFRSEAEVAKLRSGFLTTYQGSRSLNEFKTQFLDRAQFFPEYLNNDTNLKELFHRLLNPGLRQKISLVQMKSFTELYDVARGFEVDRAQFEERKRKADQSQSQDSGKRPKTGEPYKGDRPLCRKCNRHHYGECRPTASSSASSPSKTCFKCGEPGHISRDCRSDPKPVVVCYNCNREGHRKSDCPLLTEEERREEKRKAAERMVARSFGGQRGRSFQMTTQEAR